MAGTSLGHRVMTSHPVEYLFLDREMVGNTGRPVVILCKLAKLLFFYYCLLISKAVASLELAQCLKFHIKF